MALKKLGSFLWHILEDSTFFGITSFISVTRFILLLPPTQLPGLLDGCHFYLQSTFSPPTPSKKEIVQLIKNGAGTLLSRQPKPDDDVIQASTTVPYHARSGSELAKCSYFIIHDHVDSRAPPRIRTGKLCTAPICWLMDCISQFELVDLPK